MKSYDVAIQTNLFRVVFLELNCPHLVLTFESVDEIL